MTRSEEPAMMRIVSRNGTKIRYQTSGEGPALVLVHGACSDHHTNWKSVKPLLERHFTVVAVARRGRGQTAATDGHSVADEAEDVATVVRAIGEPVFLLGHSYGALCALDAAMLVPERVARLVLYEPPRSHIVREDVLARLEDHAARHDWDALVETFLTEVLHVPRDEVHALQQTPDWETWTADAPASLGDVQAHVRYTFEPERYRALAMPVMLLVGEESPRDLFVTDALAETLQDVRVVTLEGQAHEGMTTAPQLFVEAVARFLTAEAAGVQGGHE